MYLEREDGGGSRFNEMTKMWTEQGHNVTVLAGMVHYNTGIKPPKYKGKFTFIDNYTDKLEVIRCHVSEAYNKNFLGRLLGYFSFVFSSIYAGVFYAKKDYDIILVTSPPLFVGITAYILSKVKSVPFVFEIRDLWPESAIDTGVLQNKIIIKFAYWFESFIYKKAKKINVLTPAFRKKLVEYKNISPGKIIYIPNAADFSLSEELLNSFDVLKFRKDNNLENKFVITYVGAHGVANHLIQVLDCAELLIDSKDILFLLIGEGMQKSFLKEEASKRGLTNILFLDAVPKKDVFKYILASNIGASILKKVDTFKTVYSNKTFDYMSCKKPILMLIDGVSRELVEEANCGKYVEPENAEDFKLSILHYKNNPALLELEGNNGYIFAKSRFSRDELAHEYIKELELLKK